MKIRYAAMEDLDALAAIEAASYPPAEGAPRDSLRGRLESYPECFWILEDDGGRICSFINGFCTDKADLTDDMYDTPAMHDAHGAWQMIFSVVTAPERRGMGFAASVMRRALSDARRRGKTGVVLTCKERLLPFYSQFGFVDEGISSSTHGDVVWHQMRLIF